jgi:hypothetical protein
MNNKTVLFILIQNNNNNMNKEQIIRRHFHGFSDEQWDELKNRFPYCEIPAIIDDYAERLSDSTTPMPIVPAVCRYCGEKLLHPEAICGFCDKDCEQMFMKAGNLVMIKK